MSEEIVNPQEEQNEEQEQQSVEEVPEQVEKRIVSRPTAKKKPVRQVVSSQSDSQDNAGIDELRRKIEEQELRLAKREIILDALEHANQKGLIVDKAKLQQWIDRIGITDVDELRQAAFELVADIGKPKQQLNAGKTSAAGGQSRRELQEDELRYMSNDKLFAAWLSAGNAAEFDKIRRDFRRRVSEDAKATIPRPVIVIGSGGKQ